MSLAAHELLDVWERALPLPPARRALALLAVAADDAPEALARLPVGRRDAQLLRLRERLFGSRLQTLANCPACGEQLELDFDAADIRAPEALPGGPLTIEAQGYRVRFRLPSSLDLAVLAPGDSTLRLLECCVAEAFFEEAAIGASELPPAIVAAVAAEMSRADPQADVRLALVCPSCGHDWPAPFDIVAFLWAELDAWARRTLRDIHTLATAYGWREVDILALSPWRRQFYLQMVAG